jgi:hypothetical protein
MTEKRFADLAVQIWRGHKKYEQQYRVVHMHRNHPARLREELRALRTIEKRLEKALHKFNNALLGEY